MRKASRISPAAYAVLTCLHLVIFTATANSAVHFDQQFKLSASDPTENDRLGTAVALGSDAVVVYGDFNNDSAYVYDLVTGEERFQLPIPNATRSTWRYGPTVAAVGTTAVVGGGFEGGAAYVFDLTTGQQKFPLTPDTAITRSDFGLTVAASGNLAVVGASEDGLSDANLGGSTYVFDLTTGAQLHRLIADDASADAHLGRAVAIDGNIALAGAPKGNSGDPGLGSAYVFDATTGEQLFKLTGSDTEPGDSFGISVAVSGNLALVGNLKEAAYLFDLTTGEELFKLVASDAKPNDIHWYGHSVALYGNIAYVGASGRDNVSGAVYLYDVTTGEELAILTVPDSPEGSFGFSLASNGQTLVVGARNDTIDEAFRSGSAYVLDMVPEPACGVIILLGSIFFLPKRMSPITHR